MGLTKVGVGAGDSRIYKRAGSGSGASSDSFKTISTSSGTAPVADSATDTLTITGTAPIVVTGDSTTDTVTISTTSATVPPGTEQYQHLEYNGSAWAIVDHLTLGTATTPAAELRLRSTTNRIYASGASVLVIDSPRIDIHEAGSLIARFDGAALQMQSTNSVQFNTTSQYIRANSTTRIDYTAPTSHDFYLGATLYARIEATALTLDPTDGSFIPTFDSSVAGALRLFDSFGAAEVLRWTGTYQRMAGTKSIQFNASTESIYSSTSSQLDITAGGLIKSHAVTEIRDVINSNTAKSVTTSEHRWYISGNDNLYLDASVGSGKLGYYTGAVTTAYATWSSATWQLINANNSGVMNITASGTSAEINIQATSNVSVRIASTDEYFYFTRAASGSHYLSQLWFRAYDNGTTAMDDAGRVQGFVQFDGLFTTNWRMSTFVDTYEMWRLNIETVEEIGTTYTAKLFPTEVANVTWTHAIAGSTQAFGGTGTVSATSILYLTSSGNTIVFDGSAGTFNYSGSTFYIGGNSASGRTVTLQNGGIGSFTCNIVSSSEWSFTATELTVGTGNHIYIQGGGQSRYRDSTTYVYSSATNTLDLVVSSSSRAVLTAGAMTMGSATTIVCAAATTSIPSIRVPAGTAPTSPTEGDVWNDSTQKCPVNFTDGIKVYGGGIIYSQVTNTTIANTTSETTLATTTNATGTLTLPANWWTRGKVMRVTAAGVFSTKSGTTPTGRIRLLKGSTELCTSSAKTIPDIGGTSRLWTCVIYVTGLSTAFTSVMSQGTFQWINASVSVGAAHVFEVNNQTGGVATAVTIGATSEAIDLKWTWGTADALDTITCTNLIIEVIA